MFIIVMNQVVYTPSLQEVIENGLMYLIELQSGLMDKVEMSIRKLYAKPPLPQPLELFHELSPEEFTKKTDKLGVHKLPGQWYSLFMNTRWRQTDPKEAVPKRIRHIKQRLQDFLNTLDREKASLNNNDSNRRKNELISNEIQYLMDGITPIVLNGGITLDELERSISDLRRRVHNKTSFHTRKIDKVKKDIEFDRNNLLGQRIEKEEFRYKVERNSIFLYLEDISMKLKIHDVDTTRFNRLLIHLFKLGSSYVNRVSRKGRAKTVQVTDGVDATNQTDVPAALEPGDEDRFSSSSSEGSGSVISGETANDFANALFTAAEAESPMGAVRDSGILNAAVPPMFNEVDNPMTYVPRNGNSFISKDSSKKLNIKETEFSMYNTIYSMMEFLMNIKLPLDIADIDFNELGVVSKLIYLVAGDYEVKNSISELSTIVYKINPDTYRLHNPAYYIKTKKRVQIDLKMKPLMFSAYMSAEQDVMKVCNKYVLAQYEKRDKKYSSMRLLDYLLENNDLLLSHVSRLCAIKLTDRDYGRSITRDSMYNIMERKRIYNNTMKDIIHALYTKKMLREDFVSTFFSGQ